MKTPDRASFMSRTHIAKMKNYKRTHINCLNLTGVARPGKTAKDRFMREQTT